MATNNLSTQKSTLTMSRKEKNVTRMIAEQDSERTASPVKKKMKES